MFQRSKYALIATLLILMHSASGALAAESVWIDDHASRFRLLLAEMPSGDFAGGIEIQMDRGWHTYWRVPGDVGVPPLFDFSASRNVRSITVGWPVPERYDDDGGVSLIYRDQVIFPLEIELERLDEPVELAIKAFYGVCEVICIPVQSQAQLALQKGEKDTPLARISINQSQSNLPGEPVPGIFDIASVAAADKALTIEVTVPEGGDADLFSVPPDGWYLAQPKPVGRDGLIQTFRLPLAGMPKDADTAGRTFHFVASIASKAIAQSVTIGE